MLESQKIQQEQIVLNQQIQELNLKAASGTIIDIEKAILSSLINKYDQLEIGKKQAQKMEMKEEFGAAYLKTFEKIEELKNKPGLKSLTEVNMLRELTKKLEEIKKNKN